MRAHKRPNPPGCRTAARPVSHFLKPVRIRISSLGRWLWRPWGEGGPPGLDRIEGHKLSRGEHQDRAIWRCLRGDQAGVASKLKNPIHAATAWREAFPFGGNEHGFYPLITASYETMCLVKNGQLVTASTDKAYAAMHPAGDYHCVDGGPGSFHTLHPDGYNDGATAFAAAVSTAGRGKGWQVSQRTITVKRGDSAGEGGVPFGGDVSLLTVTSS